MKLTSTTGSGAFSFRRFVVAAARLLLGTAPPPGATPGLPGEPGEVCSARAAPLQASPGLAADAQTFAAALIRSGRAAPRDRARLELEYSEAGEDDAAVPRTVSFEFGGAELQGCRVDRLWARYASQLRAGRGAVG